MKSFISVFLFLVCFQIISYGQKPDLNKQTAKNAPDWITNGIIYQIQPRAFTPEGTLKAATEMLPHVADLGVTIVYLCPVFLADDDADTMTWSPRQKASKMNNPRNPYRMADYYHVDPEYGIDADLKEFIDECHRLGLRVMLDMVYLHCGSKAVFLSENPDFVKRDENGSAIKAAWNWPALNYKNNELREYLWQNMEYWVSKFDVDGFRCDVADGVPLDFWEAARDRLEKIRPDIGMLSEGGRREDQIKAFDINYSFTWFPVLKSVYEGKKTVADLRETWKKIAGERPAGARFIRYIDNHDIANDDYHNRRENRWGFAGVNAALVMNFTLDGIPFLYNGQEVADTARHSIFGRLPIYWANKETPTGQMRLNLVRELCNMRKSEKILTSGGLEWVDNDQPDAVLSYSRKLKGEQILVVINLSRQTKCVHVQKYQNMKGQPFHSILADRISGNPYEGFEIQEYGFWVGKGKLEE